MKKENKKREKLKFVGQQLLERVRILSQFEFLFTPHFVFSMFHRRRLSNDPTFRV